MPNQPATPTRSMRIPEPLWEQVERIAEDLHETKTAVVVRAIERYVRDFPAID